MQSESRLCLKFLGLISNTVNIDRYNEYKQIPLYFPLYLSLVFPVLIHWHHQQA